MPDQLERKVLAREYGYALKVIYGNKELRALFERAVNAKKGAWTPTKFTAALMDTDWWTENAGPARIAWAAQQLGTRPDGTFTADWEDQLSKAGDALDRAASQMGAQLTPEERDRFIHRYIYEGWADGDRAGLMADALAQEIGVSEGDVATGELMGDSGNLADALRQTALKNGLKLSEGYFQSAAKSVAMGLTTADDWMRDVRKQAASLWPSYSDKIEAGADAYDLMSGYRSIMADTFEVLPDSIEMDNPMLRQAATRLDDKGNPMPVGLYEFQNTLRNDPRWLDTKQAQDKLTGIGTDVLRLMGFM